MFAAERRKRIREILLESKHIDVAALCTLLSVSVATVRRDLDILENEGFLIKEHGGALLQEVGDASFGEIQLNIDIDHYSKEKREIGLIAASLIGEGECVFIGAGSTCLCFAEQLPDMNVTIVTNSLNVAAATARKSRVSTVLLGGDVETIEGILSSYGMYAEDNIQNMYLDKAFLSAQGATLEAGYTMYSREQAALYKAIIRRAEETVMLIDFSKFGKRTMVPLAPLDFFQSVVSNMQISGEFSEYFIDHGVRLYTSI